MEVREAPVTFYDPPLPFPEKRSRSSDEARDLLLSRLKAYEEKYSMHSLDFYVKFEKGEVPHTDAACDWADMCDICYRILPSAPAT